MKHKCTYCNEEFSEKDELKAHQTEKHVDELERKGTAEVSVDVEKLTEQITDKIAKAIKEASGLTEAQTNKIKEDILGKEFGAGTSVAEVAYPADLTNLTKDQKIVAFFKSLVMRAKDPYTAKHDQVFKALVEGTDAEGGYLVPEEFRAEVFRIAQDVGVMRRIARILPMNTDTLQLNTLAARPSAYWTGEYQSKTTSSAEFGRVTLHPNDLVCLLPVTHQLLNDANINLVQFITELFAEAISVAEDKAFFTGSGTGQPKGINQETLTSIDALGSVSFDDVIALIDTVSERIRSSSSAAFVGNRKVKTILRQLKDGNQNYIWRDGGSAANNGGETRRLPDTLYGYPFYEQNDLSGTELYFGDWKYYIIGDRQQMVVETTTVGGDAWRRNSMEIKAVERVDGRAVLTSAFAKIVNAR